MNLPFSFLSIFPFCHLVVLQIYSKGMMHTGHSLLMKQNRRLIVDDDVGWMRMQRRYTRPFRKDKIER